MKFEKKKKILKKRMLFQMLTLTLKKTMILQGE